MQQADQEKANIQTIEALREIAEDIEAGKCEVTVVTSTAHIIELAPVDGDIAVTRALTGERTFNLSYRDVGRQMFRAVPKAEIDAIYDRIAQREI